MWLRTDNDNGLVRLTLDRGRTHAIDPELVDQLSHAFSNLEKDESVHCVILSGAGDRFFCNGLDVASLLPLSRGELSRFYDAFIHLVTRMYLFPRPLVAAINGHAMAGGLILALTADYLLIGADNRYVGLSEVKLGLPVPQAAILMLTTLVGSRHAHQIALCGETLLPETAYRAGLVHEVTSFKHLDRVAETMARELAEKPAAAYGLTKRYLRAPTATEMTATRESSREEFVNCWFLPDTQAALRRLAERR
jgi:enoyl-CoA hydratase